MQARGAVGCRLGIPPEDVPSARRPGASPSYPRYAETISASAEISPFGARSSHTGFSSEGVQLITGVRRSIAAEN
jgi:hypothetical protein